MHILNPQKGTWVFLSFLAFFGVIVAVNTVFITTALDSHSGVVTPQPYEKGLSYNDVLAKAKTQPDIDYTISFEKGILRLELPVSGADVTASFFRAVKDGYDFEVPLKNNGSNTYIAVPDFPLSGAWTLRLKAQWNDQIFRKTREIIAP